MEKETGKEKRDMGYSSTVTGHFTIDPPLTADELRQHPEFQEAPASRSWSNSPNQECYVEVERCVTATPDGEIIKLAGTRILASSPEEDASRYHLDSQLQLIVSAYYPRHRITGYLESLGEDGDRWRLIITDGTVVSVWPTLVWPGDEPENNPENNPGNGLPAGADATADAVHAKLAPEA